MQQQHTTTRAARVVAGACMVFCSILAFDYAVSSVHYTYGDVPSANVWMVLPEFIERAVVWLVLAIVAGLFAFRGNILSLRRSARV